MNDHIETLHKVYCQFSGFDISIGYDRERAWYEYIKAGYDAEDLRLVLIHLKRGIKSGNRNPGCLRFRYLIENLKDFDEELAMARAYVRNNQPRTNRQAAIEVFRPVVDEPKLDHSLPAKEIMDKLLQEMRKASQ